jgi:hypothetical protein
MFDFGIIGLGGTRGTRAPARGYLLAGPRARTLAPAGNVNYIPNNYNYIDICINDLQFFGKGQSNSRGTLFI